MAAAKYGAIGRELEVLRAQGIALNDSGLARIREKIDSLAYESPNNSRRIYEAGVEQSNAAANLL